MLFFKKNRLLLRPVVIMSIFMSEYCCNRGMTPYPYKLYNKKTQVRFDVFHLVPLPKQTKDKIS